jgi:hypothetical protein
MRFRSGCHVQRPCRVINLRHPSREECDRAESLDAAEWFEARFAQLRTADLPDAGKPNDLDDPHFQISLGSGAVKTRCRGGSASAIEQRDATNSTIRALAESAESIRQREVARTLARLATADPTTVMHIERLSRGLVRQLLRVPIAHLRKSNDDPDIVLGLRAAFGLDEVNVSARGSRSVP